MGWTSEQKKKHDATYYQLNKVRHAEIKKNRISALKVWFFEYKETLKCELCSENHPACLDFHHINPREKEQSISRAVERGWSKEKILTEIAKCQVLCSNCHRKLHAQDK